MSQATKTGKRTRHSHSHKITPKERKMMSGIRKLAKEGNPFSKRRGVLKSK